MVDNFAKIVNKNMKELEIGSESYADQFKIAMNVPHEEDEEPTTTDYVLHLFTFYWKFILAAIPPTRIASGWLSFFVALVFVGFLTALVGDFAKMFGCVIGLEDTVTAITFVALGTSLPDTFASKTAT